jgi:peptide/nickel transport system permease protein
MRAAMLRHIAARLLATLPVMATVAVVVFAILRLTPGDPAAIVAGDSATVEQLERIRRSMGLDQPFYVQFPLWVSQLLRGDLGTSLISGVPVASMIADRIGPTLALSTLVIVISVLVAIPVGVLAAAKRGRTLDRVVSALAVAGFSVPLFVTGYALILVFAVTLGWVPVQGYVSPLSGGVGPFLHRLVLPALALSTAYIALLARITRSSVLEVLGEDYIRTARAKGIPEKVVLVRHALRNAAVPIVTVIGIGITHLIGGVVVTESVFNLPGMGRLVVEAVLARDYPVIQALILLFSFVYVLTNLAIDLIYTALDPRIRY